jgi:phage terminase large subunit-like protein
MTGLSASNLERWSADPAAFMTEVLVDPETNVPFALLEAERAFLAVAFERAPATGKLLRPEMVYSCIKKSGKSTFAAMVVIYVTLVLGGRFAEAYCLANDFEQASRVFQQVKRIVEASPLLRGEAIATQAKVEFPATGAVIAALASDYASAAGTNAVIVCFDELWAYSSERLHRLWDEMTIPPTRKIACRLVVSYAGFTGESELLEGIYKRGLAGEEVAPALYVADDLVMFWSSEPVAPWQDEAWIEQQRRSLRPSAFQRLILNQWVSSSAPFISAEEWDACVNAGLRPVISAPEMMVWAGLDASTKRDTTALVFCTLDRSEQRCRVVWHRIFKPPIKFEELEEVLVVATKRFRVREILYDPYQLVALAQRVSKLRVPMVEYPQTTGNLSEVTSNLFGLIRGQNLEVYNAPDLRQAVLNAVTVEGPRGVRLAKEKASKRIDAAVALSMAAWAAVQQGAHGMAPDARISELAAVGRSYAVVEHATAMDDAIPIDRAGNRIYQSIFDMTTEREMPWS